MHGRGLILLAALAAALPAPAASAVPRDATVALHGLTEAVRAGRVPAADAARYRVIVRRSSAAVRRLSGSRAGNLGAVLRLVAAQSPRYTAPRALALFSMLDVNTRYFGARSAPGGRLDIQDADGVVYRFFPGRGFQFHPLAEFGALNADLAAGREDDSARLAAALVARAVPARGGLAWEYYFPFAGGRPPWTSGMAQSVAAQALARASQAAGDASLLDAARGAYRAIGGALVQSTSGGPWIRLYSFNRLVVLNAQLQATISLADYAELAGDDAAAALAAGLQQSAAALLPRFDTGFWSLYALPGVWSPLEYHAYVVSLLQKLAARTSEPVWADAAARFATYTKQPPAFELGDPPTPVVARPKSKRQRATIVFWLSKPSTVTLQVGGLQQVHFLAGGWERLPWSVGSAPGVYPVSVRAVDLAGNRAQVDLPPLVVVPAVP